VLTLTWAELTVTETGASVVELLKNTLLLARVDESCEEEDTRCTELELDTTAVVDSVIDTIEDEELGTTDDVRAADVLVDELVTVVVELDSTALDVSTALEE